MQVGVGWWVVFEDSWAPILRFLTRCSFFCVAVFFALQFFLHCSFFCVAVFLHCSVFLLQFFLHCNFFCVAVGPGHAHMTPWLITHNLIYVAAADDDVDVVLSSNIFRQIFTRGEKVSITT